MVLKIAFSTDDIWPCAGHGLLKNNDNFVYMKRLNDEFGLKFTLFTVPFYKGKDELKITKYKSWIKWIQEQGFYEIAMHGLTHSTDRPQYVKMPWLELHDLPEEEVKTKLIEALNLFKECGVEIKGHKTPGWLNPKDNCIYKVLNELGLEWMADNLIGAKPIKFSNGLNIIPYTLSTENLHSTHYKNGTLILHSHMNQDGGLCKNGWNEELYQKTREFLLKLKENGAEFKPITFSELLEEEKNGIQVQSSNI